MSTHGTITNWLRVHRDNLEQLRGSTYYSKKKSLSELEQENNPDFIALDTSDQMDRAESERMKSIALESNRSKKRDVMLASALVVVAMVIIVKLCGLLATEVWTEVPLSPPAYETTEQYTYSLDKGTNWLRDQKYYNAGFRFEISLAVRPNDFWAEYGLAVAGYCECTSLGEHCTQAERKVNQFIRRYPDSQGAIALSKSSNKLALDQNKLISEFISMKSTLHGPGY